MKKLLATLMFAAVALAAALPVPSHAVQALIYGQQTSFLLDQSGTPASVTGTTAETTLATIKVPGGMMGPSGMLRISVVQTATNNANSKSFRLRWGGQIFSDTLTTHSINVQTNWIRNRGGVASQSATHHAAYGSSVWSVHNTDTVNTDQDQLITITCTLAVSTDTCTLEGYTVEILNPQR